MLIIELPKGHGVSAYLTRIGSVATKNDEVISKQHILRIGQTNKAHPFSGRFEGDQSQIDPYDVNWLCEIRITSVEQAEYYADTFKKIADEMRKDEERYGNSRD